MAIDNSIRLHQALHGYRDGHQLLASSFEIAREQQWQMLVMSDLSGPSFRDGFDGYITGYPLEQSGLYCVAKTWFAPELRRPGCVWTHTLVLAGADIARIGDLRSLDGYFRRPEHYGDLDSYATEITYEPATAFPQPDIDTAVGSALLWLLYGSPTRKVVVTADTAIEYNDVIACLFRQQWPRLRRTFRFCTGALAIRDVSFDLAIAPREVARQDTDATAPMRRSDLMAIGEDYSKEDWLRTATDDLLEGTRTSLRQLLWTYGPDYAEGRQAYRPLCEIHLAATQSSSTIEGLLSAVGHSFPEPESSRRLKSDLFSAKGSLAKSKGEASVLYALLLHPAARCIPTDVADMEERTRLLVLSDPTSAIGIATAALAVGTSPTDAYIRGLVGGIQSDPSVLADAPPALLSSLLEAEPSFLEDTAIWRVPADRQLTLAARLYSLSGRPGMAPNVVRAIMRAKAWVALQVALESFGPDGLATVLASIDDSVGNVVSPEHELLAVIREHRSELICALGTRPTLGPKAVLVAASLLDPRSSDVRQLPGVWSRAVSADAHFSDPSIDLRCRAFLLSIGLTAGSSEGPQLVRECFEAVYDGAKDGGGLDDQMWEFVEPYLPWYRVTWDRCARLIRGVVRRFLQEDWRPADFFLTFRTAEQLERAFEEVKRARGTRFLASYCDEGLPAILPDDQRAEVIAKFLHAKGARPMPELD
ncbi:MAG: hypothetical protein ABL961_14530 [Vicinamibacterales bacterium]